MNTKHLLLAATAALAVALTGCSDSGSTGTGGGSGGGGGSKFCTSTSCASGEICHPTAKVCVKTCSSTTDCPAEAKICGIPPGSTGTTADGGLLQTCGCTSSASCSTATAGNICSDYDKVCQAKCTKDGDCPNNRTCDTSSGQCSTPSGSDGGVDGGVDAGMETCSWGDNSKCTGGKICHLPTGLCQAAQSCTTGDGGAGGCPYGQFCSNGTCAEVPRPTCTNFNPDAGGKAIAWNGSSTSGPVIYNLTALPGDDNTVGGMTFCGTNQTYTVSLKAYNANSTFPTMGSMLSGLKYVREDGNEIDAVGGGPIFRLMSGYSVSANQKDVTMKISLCSTGGASPASINAGFYFTGGNEACTNVPNN